jgi:hypothetical protein
MFGVSVCVCVRTRVVLCLGRGLVTSWSPVQGVLQSAKWSRNWEISPMLQSGSKWRKQIFLFKFLFFLFPVFLQSSAPFSPRANKNHSLHRAENGPHAAKCGSVNRFTLRLNKLGNICMPYHSSAFTVITSREHKHFFLNHHTNRKTYQKV